MLVIRRSVTRGTLLVCLAAATQSSSSASQFAQIQHEAIVGNYRLPDGNVLGITLFDGTGAPRLLYSDYGSGIVRLLFAKSDGSFGIGPGFAVESPTDVTLRFVPSPPGMANAVAVQRVGEPDVVASRIPLARHEVTFVSGDAKLAGTLITPATAGPHPAIVLLHGSGRLTRHSFGPYPHFFASLGLSVLIYDKRGTGASTGQFFDRTTMYPDVFTGDALAAIRFLAGRTDIDPKRIGLWGTSEGGMLTTQVAARSKQVAFIINSSGFMVPLWEQVIYNIEAQLRADGLPDNEVSAAISFQHLATDAMRTGEAWEVYAAALAKARETRWYAQYFGQSPGFSSLESLRRQWDYVYRFDPQPALKSVTCPVLGLFGSLDTSTPAVASIQNMRRGLAEAGNRNVTLTLIEGANHPLMEARNGGNAEVSTLSRMAPDVFATLRTWLAAQIDPP